jgi:acyl-CoA synthetase (AMP-forming)/AMP-acid ligase II
VGIPDELMGNRLMALVTPKTEACTAEQIMSFCFERLPKYQLPSEIKFTGALPKNASGKVDRTKCLEVFKSELCKLGVTSFSAEKERFIPLHSNSSRGSGCWFASQL